MTIAFHWDEEKAAQNQKKHRVTFEEAATVFGNPHGLIFDDEDHSQEEQRELLIGHSIKNRLLLISFTERMGTIRIISARRATRKERQDYEENRGR